MNKNKFNFILNYTKKHYTSAIVLSAGNGTRFDAFGSKTKQLTRLYDIPVVVRAIQAFDACPIINEIIVVARADEAELYDTFITDYNIKKVSCVVVGGKTRQESAVRGFDCISPQTDYVAIHDAARCLVSPDMISQVAADAFKYGVATAAVKAKDTIKYASEDGFIDHTIDRSYVWMVQTPQIFKADIYRASAYVGRQDGAEATDDCMLAERLGFKIKLVDCGNDNIKITEPDDMYLAQAILDRRMNQEEFEQGYHVL